MRRRDRHLAFVLAGMLALNIATALCAVASTYLYRKRFRLLSNSLMEKVLSSEKSSVEAAATALTIAEFVKAGGIADDGYLAGYVSPPRVVGYGQTKSKNAIYIYRDIEEAGVTRREFVQRIPLSK